MTFKPQESTNYIIGVARPFGGLASGEASVFYYDIENRISRDAPHPDALFRNYANVVIYGFEQTGEITHLKDLNLRLEYTLSQAHDKSPFPTPLNPAQS